MLCSVVKHLQEAVEHARSREKQSSASRVFPYSSSLFHRLLCALEQSRAELGLFLFFNYYVFTFPLEAVFSVLS